jgi:hypothetical protein
MSHSPENERRHYTRIPMDGVVTLRCDGRQWQTRLHDISLKGALLQRPASYDGKDGDSCSMELLLEPMAVVIAMQGSVAHSEQGLLGFHCKHIDLDSISHLKRMVELNLGEESLLQRELAELATGE